MKTFILNDAPYGNERSYNGLRLATSLRKSDDNIQVFLMADSIFCGLKGQETPNGYYNIGRMINVLLRKGVQIHACGSCCDARGISENNLIDGVVKSNMETLTNWTKTSEQTIVF